MKTAIPNKINEAFKAAVAAIRQFGEPIEVWWQRGVDEPWDQDRHGAWSGDLADMKSLRAWVANHGCDGRTVVIYCRGESREVRLEA